MRVAFPKYHTELMRIYAGVSVHLARAVTTTHSACRSIKQNHTAKQNSETLASKVNSGLYDNSVLPTSESSRLCVGYAHLKPLQLAISKPLPLRSDVSLQTFHTVTGISTWTSVLSLGIVCTFYTSIVSKMPSVRASLSHTEYAQVGTNLWRP